MLDLLGSLTALHTRQHDKWGYALTKSVYTDVCQTDQHATEQPDLCVLAGRLILRKSWSSRT